MFIKLSTTSDKLGDVFKFSQNSLTEKKKDIKRTMIHESPLISCCNCDVYLCAKRVVEQRK